MCFESLDSRLVSLHVASAIAIIMAVRTRHIMQSILGASLIELAGTAQVGMCTCWRGGRGMLPTEVSQTSLPSQTLLLPFLSDWGKKRVWCNSHRRSVMTAHENCGFHALNWPVGCDN